MVKIKCYNLKKDKTQKLALVCEDTIKYEGAQTLNSPEAVYKFIKETLHLEEYAEENLYAIGVSASGGVTGFFKISQGTSNCSLVNPAGIFRRLLLDNSQTFFVVHNHPSNNIYPSQADLQMTNELNKAGKILGIPLLDHIIVGETSYYSFKEKEAL